MTTLNGLAEVEQALQRLSKGLTGSELGSVLLAGAQQSAQYAAQHAPRRSGTLAGAFRAEVQGYGARVFIDPSATSPGGVRAAVYGAVLDARGYRFFADAATAAGQPLEQSLLNFIRRLL